MCDPVSDFVGWNVGTSSGLEARRRNAAKRTLSAMATAVWLLLGVAIMALALGVSPWLGLAIQAVACSCSVAWLLLHPRHRETRQCRRCGHKAAREARVDRGWLIGEEASLARVASCYTCGEAYRPEPPASIDDIPMTTLSDTPTEPLPAPALTSIPCAGCLRREQLRADHQAKESRQ